MADQLRRRRNHWKQISIRIQSIELLLCSHYMSHRSIVTIVA